MRILVTGANGLVGSRLCALLGKDGHLVVGVSRGPLRGDASGFQYESCELTDAQQANEAVRASQPECVIHCASMTDVDACEKDFEKAYAANVTAAANVARASRKVGAHLVHVSTDYVFDGLNGPYSEDALPNPFGAYALTKQMGEQAARLFSPTCAIARTAIVYGYHPTGRLNFGAWLVESLRAGKSVKLFRDQIVSPSLASHVASMLGEIATRKLSGVWHVSGGEAMDRVTFGRALCEVFKLDEALLVPTLMKDVALPGPRPIRSGLTCERAKRELAHKPLGLHESLLRFRGEYP